MPKLMARLTVLFCLGLCVIVASGVSQARDHHAAITEPLVTHTVGLFGPDDTVFYSVMLASGPETLEDLTITSTLPAGATFIDVFWTPEAATFVGEADGVVTWALAALAADTIIGPFTYTVSFAEAETPVPFNVPALVRWIGGEAEATLIDETLEKLGNTGQVKLGPEGTSSALVAAGDTGAFVLVGAGAVEQPVTLTFNRLEVTDQTDLPKLAEDTWWCSLFEVAVEPAGAKIEQPITVLFPSRRTLTPGLPVVSFFKTEDNEWAALRVTDVGEVRKGNSQGLPVQIVAPGGNHIIAILIGLRTDDPLLVAQGVFAIDRTRAITDGSSNTLLPYIEQENFAQYITVFGWPSLRNP
jgi:hypothetical protein